MGAQVDMITSIFADNDNQEGGLPLVHADAAWHAAQTLKADFEFSIDNSLGAILRDTNLHHERAFTCSIPLVRMHEFAEYTSNHSVSRKIELMGFSIEAAKTGRYSALIDGDLVFSTETYPLIVFYDRRLAIRFRTSTRDLCIVTDEYWGIPHCAYDLKSDTYFDTGLSTIPIRDGLLMLLAALRYYSLRGLSVKREAQAANLSLLTGGNNNIAHFFWNYLGGACVYNSIPGRPPCVELFSLSDSFQLDGALFRLSGCHRFVPLAGLSWQERLVRVYPSVGRSCMVRLSGFGLLPPLNQALLPDAAPSSIDETLLLLTLTVRSTNRRLVDQVGHYTQVVKACREQFGDSIEVLVDGPCLQSNQFDSAASHPEFEVIRELLNDLNALGVRCRTMAGFSLTDQLREARRSKCVLTYFSGGNCKFTGNVSCPIIFMCPPCTVSDSHCRTISELPAFYSSDLVKQHFTRDHFFMDPSYLTYPNSPIPYLTPDPRQVIAVSPEQGLGSDFAVPVDHLIDMVIRSLAFSSMQAPGV